MPLNSFSEVTPIIASQSWVPADGTSNKTILAAQPTICRLDTLIGLSDETGATVLFLYLTDPSAVNHFQGTVSIPAHAGETPNPTVDIFATLFPATQVGIAIPTGWALVAHVGSAVASAISVTAYGGYF